MVVTMFTVIIGMGHIKTPDLLDESEMLGMVFCTQQ